MLYTILMCISCFIFFLPVTYYLLFTFSLDYRNDHSAWSKLERWKSSISGGARELTENLKKKIAILYCNLLLLYATTRNNFPIGLWCLTKSGLYMTTSNDQLSGWTEKFQIISQSQTCTKKCYDHCLMFCCQLDTLQLSEFQRNHSIWEVCSANRLHAQKAATPAVHCSTERTRFFFMTMPDRMSHNTYFKSWTNLASFAIFTWLLANQLPLLQASWQLFARKMLPQPAGGRKCFSRVPQIPKHRFLCYRNKQTYFSLAKMCWL